MVVVLSLLAVLSLLGLKRVCRSRQFNPPPLRLPVIAAVIGLADQETLKTFLQGSHCKWTRPSNKGTGLIWASPVAS